MHDKDSDDDTSRIISTYKNRFRGCVDIEATLGYKGFTLSGKKKVEKAKSKAGRKKQIEKNILSLDPPNITERRVMETFGLTKGQTYVALRELVDSGKLKKYGRGRSAVWKKTNLINK